MYFNIFILIIVMMIQNAIAHIIKTTIDACTINWHDESFVKKVKPIPIG